MEIISALIGLGGLFVAALSVILVYRSRLQAHSQALYDRQLLAASEAAEALVEVNGAIEEVRFRKNIDLLDDERSRRVFKDAVYQPKEKLRRVILRNSPFLPSSVFSHLSEYLAHIELVLGEMATGETDYTIGRYEQTHRPWDDSTANFALAVIAIRDFLGVGTLTPTFKAEEVQDPDSETYKKTREIIRLLDKQYDRPSSPMLGVG